ncbi:Protein YcaR in KDO2-Lipid Abiosynthesis cluster [Salmonella bongori]|nr:Protein YcaR in KDO2-Lipid Abiosynthesis cluster [Salmonella bongori]
MDHRLLEIIACPVCNGKLWYNQEKQELIANWIISLSRYATAFLYCWKMKLAP